MASRRLASLAAVGSVGLAAAVAPPAGPALAAGLPGACPDGDGVTVVVDFQELGGETIVRCAPGPQPTGLAALKNAGITVTGTARWGEAFVCRIEDQPGPAAESCIDTPPASAYWSYWHAPDGGSWTYSQLGATYRAPPPGSFEGWSFALDRTTGGAAPPRVAPRRPPAPQRPAPPPATATPPAGSQPGGQDAAPDTADAEPPADRPRTAAATPAPPTATATADPTPTPTATGTPGAPSSAPSDGDTLAARSGSGGTPVGAIVGLGLLLALLLVAAGITARRRRMSG